MAKSALPKIPKIELKLVREPRGSYEPVKIRTPDQIFSFLNFMKDLPEEKFIAVHLNPRLEIIGIQEVSHGTISSSLVHPREVFKAALLTNAHAIMVAHNHPTGDTTPSPEDKDTTIQLIAAGKLLGIPVMDHLIMGDVSISLRERFPHLWTD